MAAKQPATRRSKSDWLEAALVVLQNEGVEAVRVERLARRLGVAKSGFYWHFEDRRDLLGQLLDHWSSEYTEVVISNVELLAMEPADRLRATSEMVQEYALASFDLPVRAWGRTDAEVEVAARAVTEKRLDYVREIFVGLGFEGVEAEMRTKLFVAYETWERTMFPEMSDEERARLRELRLGLIGRTSTERVGTRSREMALEP